MTDTPTTGVVTPWYGANADPALVAHMTSHGWHEGKPEEIALKVVKAHSEAQKLIGVPADQIVRLPKDATDSAGWQGVWGRLGKPADAKDYDFTGLKYANGQEIEPALIEAIRASAFASNVTKDGAKVFAQGLIKYTDGQRAEALAARTAATETEKAALKTNWGVNFDANKVMAERGVQTIAKGMGLDAAGTAKLAGAVSALEGQAGYSTIMEMFRVIGNGMKEDSFVASGGPSNKAVMTRDQASARLSELKKDDGWVKKLMAGDTATLREHSDLTKIMVGDDTDDSRRASGR